MARQVVQWQKLLMGGLFGSRVKVNFTAPHAQEPWIVVVGESDISWTVRLTESCWRSFWCDTPMDGEEGVAYQQHFYIEVLVRKSDDSYAVGV